MIEVKNIHKSFGDNHVLQDISARFEKGKTNLIIGQSGSGKTVFIKCLLGLYQVDEGHILFDGDDYQSLTNEYQIMLRRKMGMVFQGSALFDSLSVLENVTFPLKMFTNQSESEMRERADIVLNRVNLPDAHKKLPSELSGGMQKRVAIARAIVMNPNYLFCDEPNSGLDPYTAIVIDNLIKEITDEYNITTVINTHDMNSVMEIGENIIFLKNGKKEWEGSSDDLLATSNQAVLDFVYSSELMKKIKKSL
jgi:phospholipid/cholesterol/gamma-HCH transport system ATP-binding protein